jgi:tRNA dimethylallyltransferase
LLLALFGPTAVGKTEIALELAEQLRARGERPVAVSADAIQVYEGLDVLASKPSSDELERLEHRLISFVPVEQEYSVADYAARAHAEIDALLAGGERPIVVGGTGLYLRAALTELDLKPPPASGLREEIERELAAVGARGLHEQLRPETGRSIHPNDRKRIIRALELERMGERPHQAADQLWSHHLRRPTALFGIVMARDAIAERIDARTVAMVGPEALAEVETALERGVSRTARKAMGLKELAAHLAGEVELGEARALIGRRHLAYAKRQLTWMRKLAGVEVLDRTELTAAETAAEIVRRLDSLHAPWDSASKSGRRLETTTSSSSTSRCRSS